MMSIFNRILSVIFILSVFKSESGHKYENKYDISDIRSYPIRFHPLVGRPRPPRLENSSPPMHAHAHAHAAIYTAPVLVRASSGVEQTGPQKLPARWGFPLQRRRASLERSLHVLTVPPSLY
jgi:hypothetical protein